MISFFFFFLFSVESVRILFDALFPLFVSFLFFAVVLSEFKKNLNLSLFNVDFRISSKLFLI